MRTSRVLAAVVACALGACAAGPRAIAADHSGAGTLAGSQRGPRPGTPDPETDHHVADGAPGDADTDTNPSAAPDPDTTRPRHIVITETSIEIVENIAFIADTTAIAPADVPHLDAVVHSLFGSPSIRRVEVQVYIGDGVVADRDERRRLATDRANVIVDALVARGIERERLVAVGQIDSPQEMNPSYRVLQRDDGDE